MNPCNLTIDLNVSYESITESTLAIFINEKLWTIVGVCE